MPGSTERRFSLIALALAHPKRQKVNVAIVEFADSAPQKLPDRSH